METQGPAEPVPTQPTKQHKDFQQVPMQVLPTITTQELAVIINELRISVPSLGQAIRLSKCPNIILYGFNAADYPPLEDEPF